MMKMMKSMLLILYFVSLRFASPLMRASDWSLRTRADEPQDIVDYFLRMPRCWFDEMRDTTNIFNARKEYLVGGDTRIVIVDINNAYLRIRDFEYELEEVLTITYFKKGDGSRIVAISEQYEGGDCDYYGIAFYDVEGSIWKDITEEVLPEIRFGDFCNSDTSLVIEQYITLDSNIHWNYELPRYGTTVTVSPEVLNALICFEMELQNPEYLSEDEFNMVFNDYYRIVRGRYYQALSLEWDRDKGVFFFGEKLKMH